MSARRGKVIAALVVLVATLAYLRDPPWIGEVTSGLRDWDYGVPGHVIRWTNGRASLFIPSSATAVMIPMRSGFPAPGGGPVIVQVLVDGRFLATITLPDPAEWVSHQLPLGNRPTSRRFRRIDLHVNRVIQERLLGVMTERPTIW
jgi:hypothetical protein